MSKKIAVTYLSKILFLPTQISHCSASWKTWSDFLTLDQFEIRSILIECSDDKMQLWGNISITQYGPKVGQHPKFFKKKLIL